MTERVVIIGGGQNVEHDVSVASASAVADALWRAGHPVLMLEINVDGVWTWEGDALGRTPHASLARAASLIRPSDIVFPCVHGPRGEDGALAALAALWQVRIVGSGVTAGAVGMDKHLSKLVAQDVGLAVAPGVVVRQEDADDVPFVHDVVVKPVSSGSSHGVFLARDAAELARAIRAAGNVASDGRVLVEQVIRGREIDVAVLREADGSRWAAPPLEIHADGLFDTRSKYDGTARFTVPARLTPQETETLTSAALTVFDALECAGVARIDFFLTAGGVVFNEVNTMPGVTAASQVPQMFRAAGIEYGELVRRLVAGARKPVA